MSLKLPLASALQHLRGISEYGNPIASCTRMSSKMLLDSNSWFRLGSRPRRVSKDHIQPDSDSLPLPRLRLTLVLTMAQSAEIFTDVHQGLLVGFTTLHPPLLRPSKALRRHHCRCGHVRRFLDEMSTGPVLLCSLLSLCSIALLCVLALHIL